MENIILQAAAVTMFVKVLVDAFKIASTDAPPVRILTAAFILAFVLSFLYHVASGIVMTRQIAAQTVFVAILAFGGAVGVTELQKKANAPQ